MVRLTGYFQNVGGIAGCEYLHEEIQYWEKKNINVDNLKFMLDNFKKENSALREKVGCLERKIKVKRCYEIQGDLWLMLLYTRRGIFFPKFGYLDLFFIS